MLPIQTTSKYKNSLAWLYLTVILTVAHVAFAQVDDQSLTTGSISNCKLDFRLLPAGQEEYQALSEVLDAINNNGNYLPILEKFFRPDKSSIISDEYCEDSKPIKLLVNPGNGMGNNVMVNWSNDQNNAGIVNSNSLHNAEFHPSLAFAGSNEKRKYKIKFSITRTQTGCSGITEKSVTINPKPEIALDVDGGCEGQKVTFKLRILNDITGDGVKYVHWKFNDTKSIDQSTGLPTISAEKVSTNLTESFTYVGEGERTVTATVYTNKGCMSNELKKTFLVGGVTNPNFTYKGLCADQMFKFEVLPEALHYDLVKSFAMRFDDGSPNITVKLDDFIDPVTGSLPAELPEEAYYLDHKFPEPGVYSVELEVTTNTGCNTTHTRRVPVLPTMVVEPDKPYVETFEDVEEVIEVNFENPEGEQVLEKLYVDGWVPDIRKLDDNDTFIEGGKDIVMRKSQINTWEFGEVSNTKEGAVITKGANGSANALVTNLNGPFANNENSWVFTPCFDLSALKRPMLKFQRIFDFGDPRDGAVLQYSVDNGLTWNVLGDYAESQGTGLNWYNKQGLQGRPGEQEIDGKTNLVGWGGAGNPNDGWKEARHKLDEIPFAAGERKRVIFRFAMGAQSGDNQLIGNEGFGIDDFYVGERQKTALVELFSNTQVSLDQFERLRKKLEEEVLPSGQLVNNKDAILITYKTDEEGFINSRNDNGARVLFYGISEYPAIMLNGNDGDITNEETAETELFSNIAFNQEILGTTDLNIDDADVSIDGADVNIDIKFDEAAEDQIAMTVNIQSQNAVNDLTSKGFRLYIAIVEKTVEDGDKLLRNVVRKFLPSGSGIAIDLDNQENIKPVSQLWSIQNVEDSNNLAVIAWIQHTDKKIVVQATTIDVGDKASSILTGIEDEIILSEAVTIYPNPADKTFTVGFESELEEDFNWALYNQVGQLIQSGAVKQGILAFEVETTRFTNGLHYLRIGNKARRFKHFKVLINH